MTSGIDSHILTDVSKDCKAVLELPDNEEESKMILRNDGKCLPMI